MDFRWEPTFFGIFPSSRSSCMHRSKAPGTNTPVQASFLKASIHDVGFIYSPTGMQRWKYFDEGEGLILPTVPGNLKSCCCVRDRKRCKRSVMFFRYLRMPIFCLLIISFLYFQPFRKNGHESLPSYRTLFIHHQHLFLSRRCIRNAPQRSYHGHFPYENFVLPSIEWGKHFLDPLIILVMLLI